MNDESQSYKVSATSHIACVKFTIHVEIDEDKVRDVLADGVLYNTQRAAASKAVKAMGGGKRSEIPFTEKNRQIIADALASIFPDAEIETSEYIKGGTAPEKKFAQARKSLDKSKKRGALSKAANQVGFDGELFDAETGDYSQEFLVAVDAWINDPFADDDES